MRALCIAAISVLTLAAGTLGSEQGDFSTMKVRSMHVEGWGLSGVMQQVANQENLTVGIEMDVVMGAEGHVTLDFDEGTVAQLAEKSAALVKGTSWKILNNRSILLYKTGKAEGFAGLKIEYPGQIDATRRQVWEDLSNRAEMQKWLSLEGCKRQDIFRRNEWAGDKPSITIPKGTFSLGEILETATIQSDRHFWSILSNTREGQCEIFTTLW